MKSLFLEGLLLQASLIFALGAQNIFVLEAGIKKQHPLTICFVCFLCDLLLIMLGVAGAGSLFSSFYHLKIIIGVIGVFFLFHYGLSKILSPQDLLLDRPESFIKQSLKRSIFLAITFSLFNPHAYLDAFILIGGYSSKYHILSERLVLGLGAAFFSLLWFVFLTRASSLMKPIFSNSKSLRLVTTCAGLILIFLSLRLSVDVYGWIAHGPYSSILVEVYNTPIPTGLTYSSILY